MIDLLQCPGSGHPLQHRGRTHLWLCWTQERPGVKGKVVLSFQAFNSFHLSANLMQKVVVHG